MSGLEIACRVGTTPEERAYPQILKLSIRAEFPLVEAGRSDSLAKTVDYSRIIKKVRAKLSKREFKLIEAVAETVSLLVLQEPLVQAAEVSASKKVLTGVESVGAFVRRDKKARG